MSYKDHRRIVCTTHLFNQSFCFLLLGLFHSSAFQLKSHLPKGSTPLIHIFHSGKTLNIILTYLFLQACYIDFAHILAYEDYIFHKIWMRCKRPQHSNCLLPNKKSYRLRLVRGTLYKLTLRECPGRNHEQKVYRRIKSLIFLMSYLTLLLNVFYWHWKWRFYQHLCLSKL